MGRRLRVNRSDGTYYFKDAKTGEVLTNITLDEKFVPPALYMPGTPAPELPTQENFFKIHGIIMLVISFIALIVYVRSEQIAIGLGVFASGYFFSVLFFGISNIIDKLNRKS